MKKQVSKLIAILVVITMLPLGSISANAVPNRPLPPRGGESRIVWHHHGWGIGTIEVFLSNNSINNINRLFDIGSSDAAKIVSIASTFRDLAGAASAPAAIIPIVAKEFVSMLIAEGFDRLQNANSGRDGVIFTMGVTQWGNNTTRFRPQLMRMGTPQMREIRHDSVRVFANPNDLNSIGTLGRTRISVIGTRLDAFEDNMRWYLLDSGGWIRAVMASEVPRDINITATAYPSGRGTVMGVGDGTLGFYRGQRVRLSAHPSRGWEFSGWYENGNRITGLNPLEFSAEQRRTIQARFRYTGAQIIRDRVAITTTSLPDGQVRRAFNARILATGATPITWTVASGSLPNGLNLNRNTGEITGTPTTEGTFTFTVRAANNATRDERQFTIRINDNTLQVWQMEILPASGQRFTTRADTPVRERPYARYPILERFPIGRAITVNGRGRNSEGNMWYRFTENGRERWIYSGNLSATNPVPQTPPVCTNHNWNDRGFCTRCGAEFRIN
ncbi:MAG: Ig domain-containing protein, partial [Oscillospiraceae bacterium]|nr:Ig domain-containing protein [Oscillospiraceae bacterium]